MKSLVKYNNNAILTSDFIMQLNDELLFQMQDVVNINDIIIFKNKEYKVKGIDDTIQGFYTYYAKYQNTSKYYSIEVESNVEVEEGKTIQLNVVCKEDGIVLENQVLNYIVDDESIVSVSDGAIRGVKEGTTKITIEWNNIRAEVQVTVTKVNMVVYTISGQEEIKRSTTQTYTISPNANGVFELLENDGSVEIISQDNLSITLKGVLVGGFDTIQYKINNEVVSTFDVLVIR